MLNVRDFHMEMSNEVFFFFFQLPAKIGPPELSLACCGNCIQMNMSLVEPNSTAGISGIHEIYDVKFRVRWRKEETEVVKHLFGQHVTPQISCSATSQR